MSTLAYAVLELIARRPATGYEITQRMRKPVGYMWTSTHSAVYGELTRMESDGLLSSRVIDGPGPRDTKRYRITERGRRHLAAWVDSPLTPAPVRDELMLRIRGLWLISPDRARALVERVLSAFEQRLAEYESEEHAFADEGIDLADPSGPEFASYATLQAGLVRERGNVEWCGWLLGRLSDDH